ncbi:MAG: hypothetical protein FD147_2545 [Chloroflexi bacterium]|nr:MAG: hypothetical protein FD147_2545 [Chloroflexota bacterium]
MVLPSFWIGEIKISAMTKLAAPSAQMSSPHELTRISVSSARPGMTPSLKEPRTAEKNTSPMRIPSPLMMINFGSNKFTRLAIWIPNNLPALASKAAAFWLPAFTLAIRSSRSAISGETLRRASATRARSLKRVSRHPGLPQSQMCRLGRP